MFSLDPSILASAALLPEQIKQAWEEVSALKLPEEFKKVGNIIVAGMGGSALGARIIDALAFEILTVPLEIVNGYHLPAYVGPNSLVIISSYSGNTEETVSCAVEAIKKKAQIFLISTGGKIGLLSKKKKLPAYIFNPKFNPAKQPRLGLGYSIASQMAVLARSGLINLEKGQLTEVINFLKDQEEKASLSTPISRNPAKQMAQALKGRAIAIISSEHLVGAAHAFKNMINENSKNFAAGFSIPEMNHHLLEGLAHPRQNRKFLKFVFLESALYDSEIKKRFKITQEIVRRNKVPVFNWVLKGRTRLTQVFEVVYLGAFVSSYLALAYRVDPIPIPWVDYFKAELKKF